MGLVPVLFCPHCPLPQPPQGGGCLSWLPFLVCLRSTGAGGPAGASSHWQSSPPHRQPWEARPSQGRGGWPRGVLQPSCPCCRATIDEVETDVVEIEAKLDKVRACGGGQRPSPASAHPQPPEWAHVLVCPECPRCAQPCLPRSWLARPSRGGCRRGGHLLGAVLLSDWAKGAGLGGGRRGGTTEPPAGWCLL